MLCVSGARLSAGLQVMQSDPFFGCDIHWGLFSDRPEQGVPFSQLGGISDVLVLRASSSGLLTVRRWLWLLGHMAAVVVTIPWSRLALPPCWLYLLSVWDLWSQVYKVVVPVTEELRMDLCWLAFPASLLTGVFLLPRPPLVLASIASSPGWGSSLEEDSVQAIWSGLGDSRSSSWRDWRADLRAVKHFQVPLRGRPCGV